MGNDNVIVGVFLVALVILGSFVAMTVLQASDGWDGQLLRLIDTVR